MSGHASTVKAKAGADQDAPRERNHPSLPQPTLHDYRKMEEHFDPMRLKIIMMPKKGANPFGKNPDFFFIQGIDYLNAREV